MSKQGNGNFWKNLNLKRYAEINQSNGLLISRDSDNSARNGDVG